MTAKVADTAIQQGIMGWLDSLSAGRVDQLSPGDVLSALGDICIDARETSEALPETLRALYVEASKRFRDAKKGYPSVNFHISGIQHDVNAALQQP
jgi:hypothetical protein